MISIYDIDMIWYDMIICVIHMISIFFIGMISIHHIDMISISHTITYNKSIRELNSVEKVQWRWLVITAW